ncbi:uncharacterized protein MAM_02558 [Metarhizium album ARSEF 1941]|uniref:Uncharacterized protein n=1 Tax=Metarhizium album (strain ARSEF 1941) TaxID=1081103 RepID=A0A0B2X326_METAS|nr:uncharacterized protein MAM_02558 [Metarhizium album ARSEF 1941]KHN99705.1 hypothetical protein MAM_02558 [Metarhizium album ARSEF 1941]
MFNTWKQSSDSSLNCQYGTQGDAELNIGAVQGRRRPRQRSGVAVPASTSPRPREAIPGGHLVSPRSWDVGELLSDDVDRSQIEVYRKETDWSDLEITFASATAISSASRPASRNPSTHAASPRSDTPLNSAVGMFDLIDRPEQMPRGDMEAFLAQSPLEYSMRLSGSNLCPPEGSSPLLHLLATSDTTTPADVVLTKDDAAQSMPPVVENNNNNNNNTCPCPVTALDTWEMLMTNISSKEPATDDFVRCQRAAMSSCEALVRCHACSSRSQDVMLLIDMCAKLLESLKTQHGQLFTCHQQSFSERRLAEYGHATEDGMVDDGEGDFDNDDNDDNGGGDDDDNEEEDHAPRSPWMARMRRLGRLIARVGALLDGDEWLTHRCILQGVQVRFTSVLFDWQH